MLDSKELLEHVHKRAKYLIHKAVSERCLTIKPGQKRKSAKWVTLHFFSLEIVNFYFLPPDFG